MKRSLLFLSLIIGLAFSASAQVCTPDSSHFTAGVIVYPATLSCITQNQAQYSGTVNIRIPDSVDAHIFINALPANTYYLYVDSIRLDSITGAPAGISTATNPGSGVWLYPGQYGCVQFSGSTSAAVGSYPLSIYGGGCVHGNIGGQPIDSCQTGLLPPFINYSLSVCAPVVTPVCTPDSAQFTPGVYVYPPSLPCILQNHAYAGTVSLKVPDSIDAHLFVAAVPANTYYLHIDSMRLDSITGAPAGISVAVSTGDTAWLHGGQYGCAQFTGTTSVAPGNFPIGIYGRGCVHGNVFGIPIDSCVSGSLSSYFNYSLNVCNGSGACTVDTTHFSSTMHVYPASLPCITTGLPFAGQINIQVPDSLDGNDFINQIPPGTIVIHIDSININSITGYPAGITGVSNPVLTSWLQPGSFACHYLTGTVNAAVTPAGNYNLTISGIGCGHGTFPLVGYIDTCMAVTFSREFPYSLSVCYPAGVTEITEGLGLNIYPNPNQGTFTVTVSSADHISGKLSVMDQLGRVIHAQDVDVTGTQQIPLSLGNISAGVYILMINTSNGRTVKSFSVK